MTLLGVRREDLAGVEGDDRDPLLVDDGQDPPARECRTDLMWYRRPARRRVTAPLPSVTS
jgi:hypothetical protein